MSNLMLSDDTVFEDEGFLVEESPTLTAEDMDDIVEESVVEESMLQPVPGYGQEESPQEFTVEEEPEFVPGSNAVMVEEEEQHAETKETNWEEDGDHAKFLAYLKQKVVNIPKHSGQTVPGCERARAYLKSLNTEISKAMRSDLEGKIDEAEIDKIRKSIDEKIERLEKQIGKLNGGKVASVNVKLIAEGVCEKCGSNSPMWHDVENNEVVCMSCENNDMVKTAGTPALNVYVSAFERAIVGMLINSVVSAGRDIEETYEKLCKKYKLTDREELAIQQLVADYGYPVYKDRGLLGEDDNPSSGKGIDFQTNYHA